MSIPASRTALRRCVLLFVALVAPWSSVAVAQNYVFEGPVRIAIAPMGTAPSAGQCLIRGDNGKGDYVRFLWSNNPGTARWCGFPDKATFRANGQGVFEIMLVQTDANAIGDYWIKDQFGRCLAANPDGTTRPIICGEGFQQGVGMWRIDTRVRVGSTLYASIRSKSDDRCLIFSNNGHDARPTLYRWGEIPGDSLYCGLGIDRLMESGQGLFTFSYVD